jgi:hypothetical protein
MAASMSVFVIARSVTSPPRFRAAADRVALPDELGEHSDILDRVRLFHQPIHTIADDRVPYELTQSPEKLPDEEARNAEDAHGARHVQRPVNVISHSGHGLATPIEPVTKIHWPQFHRWNEVAHGNCGIVNADRLADSAQPKQDFVILTADERVANFSECRSPPTGSYLRLSTERKVAANRKPSPPAVIDVPLDRIAVVQQSERAPRSTCILGSINIGGGCVAHRGNTFPYTNCNVSSRRKRSMIRSSLSSHGRMSSSVSNTTSPRDDARPRFRA